MNPASKHSTVKKHPITFLSHSGGSILLVALMIIPLASLPVSAATSPFYLGLSYTNNDIDLSSPAVNENTSNNSAGIVLAYRFSDWMAVELAYQPASDTEVSFSDGVKSYQANYEFNTSLSVLAQYNFTGTARNWAILGKLGLMQGKSEIKTKEIIEAYRLIDGVRSDEPPLTAEEIDNLPFDDAQAFLEALRDAVGDTEYIEVSNHDSSSASETVPLISTGFRYTCKRESLPLCPEWLVNQLGFSFEVSYFKLEPELFGEKHDIEVIQQSLGLQWYFY